MLTRAKDEAHKVPVTLVALPRIHLLVEVAVDFILPLTWSYHCHIINFASMLGTNQRLAYFFVCYATYANRVMAQAHQKICTEGNLYSQSCTWF